MALPILAELNRRRVFRAVVVYGVVAFAVLQIIEPIMHGLHWPDSVLSYVVVGLAVGFPVVVGFAWAFDVTSAGIEWHGAPAAGAHLRGARLYLVLVAIGVVAAAPGLVWYFLRHAPREAPRAPAAALAPSIAVLPFADMSPQHDQEYFADGVAEEILNALAHVDGLRVPGRTSSFYFKGKSVRLADVGRELRVAHVLEGSVRKDGSRVRITAQLVRVDDETHLWSETFERELSGVFAVQDDVANAVVKALKMTLPPASTPTPARAIPRSPESYGQYLLGRHVFYRWSPETLPRALEYFERAIALDPDYAPAWAFVSFTITQMEALREKPTPGSQERALAAAEKAIVLAPDESTGYVARAYFRNHLSWDWAGAQSDCESALSRKTSHVNPHNQYSLLLGALGRTREAIAFARKPTDLDPLNTPYWTNLGAYYLAAGELDLARAAPSKSPPTTHAEPSGWASWMCSGVHRWKH